MSYVISTLVFGAVIWWLALGPGRKAGDQLSPFTRKVLGVIAGLVGILLAMRGRWDFAIVLVSISGWLLGLKLPAMFDPIGRARRSEIRTAALHISIDLGSGALEAKILAGTFAGRMLDALKPDELIVLARELLRVDPSGLNLILQDLDRRSPGWRQHVQFDASAGQAAAAGSAEMREEEAYQILGIEPGATEEAIRAAHRALIARIHPDRGGSTHLAALVNRAKDIALARARGT